MEANDHQQILELFNEYVRMYSSRDDRLTTRFSEDFSGFTGGGDFLVKDKAAWIAITRQDFAQVKEPIRIEIKDLAIQALADTIAVATAFFHIHLPIKDHILSRETARLVLIFRREATGWMIAHSSISIPYHLVREGEVYPLKELVDHNQFLEEQIAERTIQLSEANEQLKSTNEKLQQEIAEHLRTEEEKARLEAQLQQSQKMESLGILVAGVAHNINNVLAIIMSTASLREQILPGPPDLKAYDTIGKACRRGRDVVTSLMQFARPTLSSQAPFDLHGLIREVCDLLGNTTSDRIRIAEAFAERPLWIFGDAGAINHALMNLFINSLDAMPTGGTLTLRTTVPEEDWAEVSVEDSGEGMPPEVLAHVLEPFFTTKDVGKGTGLGLSMTYGVVKAHGGSMAITSTPGQGTTVRLRFPRVPAPRSGALEPKEAL